MFDHFLDSQRKCNDDVQRSLERSQDEQKAMFFYMHDQLMDFARDQTQQNEDAHQMLKIELQDIGADVGQIAKEQTVLHQRLDEWETDDGDGQYDDEQLPTIEQQTEKKHEKDPQTVAASPQDDGDDDEGEEDGEEEEKTSDSQEDDEDLPDAVESDDEGGNTTAWTQQLKNTGRQPGRACSAPAIPRGVYEATKIELTAVPNAPGFKV